MNCNPENKRRSGFTLVEMLIVVSIIGILAAIILPAILGSTRSAGEAAIAIEIGQLQSALETFKKDNGLRYPCDFTHPDPDIRAKLMSASVPGNRESLAAIKAGFTGAAGYVRGDSANPQLDPAEALVYWLSMTKKNTSHPITGSGDSRTYFEFDEERLVDSDNDGFPEFLPNNGEEVPYVYFNFQTYDEAKFVGDTFTHPVSGIQGQGFARPYKTNSGAYHGAKSIQIICAGYDGHYGADSPDKTYPSGANMSDRDHDNVTSFSEGRVDNRLP